MSPNKLKNQISQLKSQMNDLESSLLPVSSSSLDSLFGSALTDSDLKRKELWLFDEINPTTTLTLIRDIVDINAEDDAKEREAYLDSQVYTRHPIKLYINTPGGHVTEGFALIDAIESSKTPVHVYATGSIASMGILVVASAHKALASKYTRFMIHSLSFGAMGTLGDVQVSVEEAERIQDQINTFIVDHTIFSLEEVEDIVTSNLDYYFDAEEALEKGLIQEIV